MVDWNKPLRTVGGKLPVKFLHRLNNEDYYTCVTIETAEDGTEKLELYTEEGKFTTAGYSVYDLENVPEVHHRHIIVDSEIGWATLEDAQDLREKWGGPGAKIMRITFEDGVATRGKILDD